MNRQPIRITLEFGHTRTGWEGSISQALTDRLEESAELLIFSLTGALSLHEERIFEGKKELPAEEYIEMYAGVAEHLMRRDGVKLKYKEADEFGNVERTDEAEDLWIDYCDEAEGLLNHYEIYQEGYGP
jgi:hypothetical protein